MTWPTVELDQITRLRAVAAAYPNAGVGEVTVDVPFDEAWPWIMDFERNTPRVDRALRKVRILSRDGDRLTMLVWQRFNPIPVKFDVTIEPGFCIMRARRRLFIVLMAAEPAGEGRTRYAHAEMVPLPRTGWLRRVFQLAVKSDLRGVVRNAGT